MVLGTSKQRTHWKMKIQPNDEMLTVTNNPWWRHQTETFSALLTICAGKSPVTGEFPALRPVTRGFDVFFDLRLNKRLSKQSWGWWFETLLRPLWRHCNDVRNDEQTLALIIRYNQQYKKYNTTNALRPLIYISKVKKYTQECTHSTPCL